MDRWQLGHRPGLDGLRGVAVLLVFVCHALEKWWHNALGAAGVTMFFTLSGFLITTLLLRDIQTRGRIRWGHFYARRARRLLPALALVVAAAGTLQGVAGVAGFGATVPVVGYVANWAMLSGVDLGWLSHTWSLAIEEQFYLVWPVVLALMARWVNGAMLIAGAGVVASLVGRFALWNDGAGADRVYFGSDTRADAILIGCLLAFLLARGWRPRVNLAGATAALVGLVALMALAPSPYMTAVMVPTVAPWLTVALILAGLDRPGWLGVQPLIWWGRRSYGIYLWHFPLMYAAHRATGSFTWVVAAGVVSVGLAALSWRYLEQPILRGAQGHGMVGVHTSRLRNETSAA